MDHPESSTSAADFQSTAPAPSNRRALFIVFLVVFIDLLGFGIVLPMLPVISDRYVGEILGPNRDPKVEGLIVGLLMATFSLMQFLFAPGWGRLSDRVGRRPILLLGLAGSVVFYSLFGFAASLPGTSAQLALTLLFIARSGAGVAGATIATAQAVIADSTAPEKRRHGMALIGAAFGIGFTFGPLIAFAALKLFPEHLEAIGYAAAGLSLIALLLGFRLLPETRRSDGAPATRRKMIDFSAIRMALGSRSIGPVILTFFLASLGFAAFETTLALLLKEVFGLPEDSIFLAFAYVGLVLMFTQGFLYRRLARRLGEVAFMTLGIVFMAAGVGGLGAVTVVGTSMHEVAGNPTSGASGSSLSWPMLIALGAALTASVVGFAFLTPSAQALVSRRTDPNLQGEILGVNQSASAMARILGPIFGVVLYKTTATHLLPYAFGAALLILMLPMMPRISRG